MTRRRQGEALVLLGAIALACSPFGLPPPAPPCTTDSDCDSPAICFPDGCGDPGRDIKVQVTHASTAQEFEVPELHATYDQQLRRPSTLSGEVSQQTATGPVPFSGKVTFKAVGSALFLPGVPRRAEATLVPNAGQFSFPLSSGLYSSLMAMGPDSTIPPVVLGEGRPLQVAPGDQPQVDVTFPHASELVRISGLLLKTLAFGPLSEPMEVLVLHPVSRRPMTQAQPVDPLTGAFSVLAPPEALSAGSPVLLMARPQSGAFSSERIIPQQIFTIPNPTVPLLLELGDFGLTVTVTGTVKDANDGPVEGATVYIEGTAEGGGTFQGMTALTAAETGAFSLRSLPSATGGTLTLWVIPPASSSAGRFQAQVAVPLLGGPLGTFHCPRRVPVRGEVRRPDGQAPASGVAVRAEPVGGLPGSPSPSFSLQAVTDGDGLFSFLADPGEYRLDFAPADTLPKVSRRVRVEAVLGGDGKPLPVQVPAFTLWNGRTLTGTITGFADAAATEVTPLAGAAVELWRVVWEDGKKVAYSLGQGTTDASGRYSVVLPTAPPALRSAPDGGSPDGG